MSRKGNKLIPLNGANVSINSGKVNVKGSLGSLDIDYPSDIITVENTEGGVKVSRKDNEKRSMSMHGTVNSNINNAVIGVTKGYSHTLDLVGVGYKATASADKLTLNIGFSHPLVFKAPAGVKVATPNEKQIVVSGYDKIKVGQLTAEIRAVRPPEPYKGKGIFRDGEKVIRKVGKTAESTGGKK